MNTFMGKNVLMTGATGGIGSKVAKKLIKAGIFSLNCVISYGRC
jgi:NAD(P)-dependent dehydrogenase (short-subunit alcohol dehydrogenase family)